MKPISETVYYILSFVEELYIASDQTCIQTRDRAAQPRTTEGIGAPMTNMKPTAVASLVFPNTRIITGTSAKTPNRPPATATIA